MFDYHFFFNDTATTEIYTLSLHDALPILFHSHFIGADSKLRCSKEPLLIRCYSTGLIGQGVVRSEEHTSELQSLTNLVCRLLLEKKKREKIQEYVQQTETSAAPRTYTAKC